MAYDSMRYALGTGIARQDPRSGSRPYWKASKTMEEQDRKKKLFEEHLPYELYMFDEAAKFLMFR
jgi:hypothetical protein